MKLIFALTKFIYCSPKVDQTDGCLYLIVSSEVSCGRICEFESAVMDKI